MFTCYVQSAMRWAWSTHFRLLAMDLMYCMDCVPTAPAVPNAHASLALIRYHSVLSPLIAFLRDHQCCITLATLLDNCMQKGLDIVTLGWEIKSSTRDRYLDQMSDGESGSDDGFGNASRWSPPCSVGRPAVMCDSVPWFSSAAGFSGDLKSHSTHSMHAMHMAALKMLEHENINADVADDGFAFNTPFTHGTAYTAHAYSDIIPPTPLLLRNMLTFEDQHALGIGHVSTPHVTSEDVAMLLTPSHASTYMTQAISTMLTSYDQTADGSIAAGAMNAPTGNAPRDGDAGYNTHDTRQVYVPRDADISTTLSMLDRMPDVIPLSVDLGAPLQGTVPGFRVDWKLQKAACTDDDHSPTNEYSHGYGGSCSAVHAVPHVDRSCKETASMQVQVSCAAAGSAKTAATRYVGSMKLLAACAVLLLCFGLLQITFIDRVQIEGLNGKTEDAINAQIAGVHMNVFAVATTAASFSIMLLTVI